MDGHRLFYGPYWEGHVMATPTLTPEEIKAVIAMKKKVLGEEPQNFLYGVRGFFDVGVPFKNDRAVYDDAIFLINCFEYQGWNANTDPTKYQTGIATLRPGIWWFTKGLHGVSRTSPYPALIQNGNFTVERDGGKIETGHFNINIHRGGQYTTGSAGCQTIIKDQWSNFINEVYARMTKYDQKAIPYILVEKEQRAKA